MVIFFSYLIADDKYRLQNEHLSGVGKYTKRTVAVFKGGDP